MWHNWDWKPKERGKQKGTWVHLQGLIAGEHFEPTTTPLSVRSENYKLATTEEDGQKEQKELIVPIKAKKRILKIPKRLLEGCANIDADLVG